MADEAPTKKTKKRRKKKKRRRKEASADQAVKKDASKKDASKKGAPKKGAPKRDWGSRIWIVLLALGAFELWLFGRQGHIEVCVAKEGVHDFALLGQPRTDQNTRRYPTCEKRLNVGITSRYVEALEDAQIHACRRANILRPRAKEDTILCVIKEDNWKHQTTLEHCPPWHDHYYKRLFWFAYGD